MKLISPADIIARLKENGAKLEELAAIAGVDKRTIQNVLKTNDTKFSTYARLFDRLSPADLEALEDPAAKVEDTRRAILALLEGRA